MLLKAHVMIRNGLLQSNDAPSGPFSEHCKWLLRRNWCIETGVLRLAWCLPFLQAQYMF